MIKDGDNNRYRLQALIKPSYDESNRNDPRGEREKENGGFQDFKVNIVDIFSEFQEAMTDGVCAEDVSGDVDGDEDF